MTRLREKACEYGQLNDEMIRNKLVLGIAHESTRRRLLREKELTLVTAIEMCCTAEQTDIRMRVMDTASSQAVHMEALHSVAKQPPRQSKVRQSKSNKLCLGKTPWTCKYCENAHSKGNEHCPAFGKKCKLCGTNNHYARVCQKSMRGCTPGKVHCMDERQRPQNRAVRRSQICK